MSTTEKSTRSASETFKKIEGHAKPIIAFITSLTPVVITYCQKAHGIYKTLPEDQLQFLIGAIICFFGGVYPALFAAIEAAKHGGLTTLKAALKDLADEASEIIEASKKDDKADDDKDGTSDVAQLDAKALLVRKANLVATKMNPQKVNNALASLYKVWLAVMAVLAIKFARTVAFAESICLFIRKPTRRVIVPNLLKVCPEPYHKWVPILSDWITKLFAVSVAFYITSIIAAFTSALIGGLMMTRAFLKIASKQGWTLGGLMPTNEKDTMLDEIVSYVIAFLGFSFQWKMNFDVPFPFSLLLFPIELAEQFIRWSVSKVD
mmetsp:Transcript_7925/g.11961  ORF Transcript_7925/g.11961 Transcript_7925/m.11961 type:complete len:321 (-) Transcript_7925:183-1145(-)